jgi:4'-phosphopantetheinyl transferase
MTELYWLEQTEGDVPAENDWLGPGEALRLDGLRFPKRRADWRLGRWTAKRALALCLRLPDDPQTLARIEIRPAPSGAPEVFLANQASAATISLSHCCGKAVCAVALAPVALGCDLERIEPRSDTFIGDYFTAEEQALVTGSSDADRARLLALLWCGKESALKALQAGLRLDTRSVIVRPTDFLSGASGWQPLQVSCADGQLFHGWWQQADDFMQSVVSTPPPGTPARLRNSSSPLSTA